MMFEELSPPYGTIVVDPPWPYENQLLHGYKSIPMKYSLMSVDEIRQLPVTSLGVPGCHLYLWTTQRFIWEAKEIVDGWGFRPLKVLTWCKPKNGPGGSFSNTTEFVLFCRHKIGKMVENARELVSLSQSQVEISVRGKVTRICKRWEDDDSYPNTDDWVALQRILPALAGPNVAAAPEASDSTWFDWPRGGHSEKPAAFFDLVEQVSPGARLELFARQPRLGWDHWGHGYESGVLSSLTPSRIMEE